MPVLGRNNSTTFFFFIFLFSILSLNVLSGFSVLVSESISLKSESKG